jgi:purine-binding chemotaxis protein CheW
VETGDRSPSAQYLTLSLAQEDYALPILAVREIVAYGNVTRVPGTPPWIRGVIDLRGHPLPVVDLAMKLGLPESRATRWSCIIIVDVRLDAGPPAMGLMADRVNQVIDRLDSDIEEVPGFGPGATHVPLDYVRGMTRDAGGFVLILDVDRVLSSPEPVATAEA